MGMVKKGTITAKAPSIGTVQVDNEAWVKVDKEKMAAVKVGDTLERQTENRPAEERPILKAKSKSADAPAAIPAPKQVEQSVWDRKDRAQLVGGRSHDAVELVKASLMNATPLPKVMELYKEALTGLLGMVDEIK